ncbi:hypothetical protein AB1Y20_003074 [Prymnesium parvum]|uniref:Calcineurin-like phosphoesterase domain-containing protein n=1 Tax=Prymnesium parvum TaxID=97485 RepID=A0AB34JAU2_PRYPA
MAVGKAPSRRNLLLAAAPVGLLLGGPAGPARGALPAPTAPLPPSRLAAPGRVVAIGDLHGDAAAFARALRLAGVYEVGTGWVGGQTVLVQLGDVLDRGDQEMGCLRLLREVKRSAAACGGAVVSLLGNHEAMNAAGITYMASPRAAAEFEDRATAFLPGSALALELATWPVVCVVGDTAFCHAGLSVDDVVAGVEAINARASSWLRAEHGRSPPPDFLFPSRTNRGGPLWSRVLSDPPDTEPSKAACDDVRMALRRLGAARLVVGHTVQQRINCACGCSVFRIDVGLSAAMRNATPQVLEILPGGVVNALVEAQTA